MLTDDFPVDDLDFEDTTLQDSFSQSDSSDPPPLVNFDDTEPAAGFEDEQDGMCTIFYVVYKQWMWLLGQTRNL